MGLFDDIEVEDKPEYTPIDDGNYGAVIDEVALDLTNERGPQFQFTYKITHSPSGKFINRKIWSNIGTANSKAKQILAMTTQKLGLDYKSAQSEEHLAEMLQSTMGKHVELYVKKTPKKNKPGEFYTNGYVNKLQDKDSLDFAFKKSSEPSFDASEEMPF